MITWKRMKEEDCKKTEEEKDRRKKTVRKRIEEENCKEKTRGRRL